MRSAHDRRMDEDHICPSCIKPCFFAHECDPKDINVAQQVQKVIANSQLSHYLEEAQNPHITHLQASNPVNVMSIRQIIDYGI